MLMMHPLTLSTFCKRTTGHAPERTRGGVDRSRASQERLCARSRPAAPLKTLVALRVHTSRRLTLNEWYVISCSFSTALSVGRRLSSWMMPCTPAGKQGATHA